MIAWLRRRWWALEDAVTDLLLYQPRPASPKPLPPAPPEEPKHYVPFHFTAVGLQRADPQAADALWQQQLFRQMAKGFCEIGY